MKLRVRSNGNEVQMPKELYEKLPELQKRAYDIISKEDAEPVKSQAVKNEAKQEKPAPPSGEKKNIAG